MLCAQHLVGTIRKDHTKQTHPQKTSNTPTTDEFSMALKDWSLALRDFLSHAGTVLAMLASLVVPTALVVPANPAPTKRLHHHHHQQQNPDEQQQPNDNRERWLASRGYRDSFSNDDEIQPDPRENVLIDDENNNNNERLK